MEWDIGKRAVSRLEVKDKMCAHWPQRTSNSRMFTRLDELEIGDILLLTVCGETLAYRVYGTEVVEPEDIERLKQQPGEEICFLW